MANNPNDANRCEQLRKLKANILNEIASLQMNRTQEEDEGVGNPIEIVGVIKTLQETLATIDLELQKCPPIA